MNGTTIYTDGTIDFTNGSTAIVGHGTLWTGLVNGDTTQGPDGKWYEITFTDDTHATLDRAYQGTTAAGASSPIFKNSAARDSVRNVSKQLSTLAVGYGSALNLTGTSQAINLNKLGTADNAGVKVSQGGVDLGYLGTLGDNTVGIEYYSSGGWHKAFSVDPTTGIASIAGALSLTGGLTLSGGGLALSGNISSAAWGTSGLRYKGFTATLTDTTSTGTVSLAYTNAHGGCTIAAGGVVTFTNYYGSYFTDPVAGANVTLTNKWALGADSAKITNLTITGTLSGNLIGLVRYDSAQPLTTAQQLQARSNIGILWRPIAIVDITSATAAVDIVLPTGLKVIRLTGWLDSDASNGAAMVQTSADGGVTFASGSADYSYGGLFNSLGTAVASNAANANGMFLAGGDSQPNIPALFTAILSLGDAAHVALMKTEWACYGGGFLDGQFTAFRALNGAINAIRILENSGNIATGHVLVEGF